MNYRIVRNRWRGLVLVVSAPLVLVAAVGIVSAGDVVPPRALSLHEQIAQASETVEFEILVPSWLPPDYELTFASWYGPDATLGTTASTVDLFFEASGRPMIHIYQTDDTQTGAKDPTRVPGRIVAVAGTEWTLVESMRAIDSSNASMISTTIDGVIVSVDSGLGTATVVAIAQSLGPMQLVRIESLGQ